MENKPTPTDGGGWVASYGARAGVGDFVGSRTSPPFDSKHRKQQKTRVRGRRGMQSGIDGGRRREERASETTAAGQSHRTSVRAGRSLSAWPFVVSFHSITPVHGPLSAHSTAKTTVHGGSGSNPPFEDHLSVEKPRKTKEALVLNSASRFSFPLTSLLGGNRGPVLSNRSRTDPDSAFLSLMVRFSASEFSGNSFHTF